MAASLPSNWMKLKGGKPTTDRKTSVSQIQQSLVILKRFFIWARKEGYTEKIENPCSDIELPCVRRKQRLAFPREIVDLACNFDFPSNQRRVDETAWRLVILSARYSGMRLGEICQLTVSDVVEVDGVRCFHVVEDASKGKTTKSHQDRLVPVLSKLERAVNGLIDGRVDGPLFGKVGTYTDANGVTKFRNGLGIYFNQAVKSLGDYSFHLLRHYAVSEMAKAGVAEEIRMRVVGHRLKSVHQEYTHLGLGVLKEAVEKIM